MRHTDAEIEDAARRFEQLATSSTRPPRQLMTCPTCVVVTGLIGPELSREGLPTVTFGRLGEQELLVARTADRSVLGCMTDMAILCEHAIGESGGQRHADLAGLKRALQRNINSTRAYQRPIDTAAQRVPTQA